MLSVGDMLSRKEAGKKTGNKDVGCHVDHSSFVLSRLYELVDSHTCDVVFCCTSVPSTGERSRPTGETPERERERESHSSITGGNETGQENQAGAVTAAGAAPTGGRDNNQEGGEDPTADGTASSSSLPSPVDNASGSCPRVASKEFRCHRLLFASSSEYFRALLYGGMSESETRRVELKDVAPQVFEAIVAYVYTGRVRLAAGKGDRKTAGSKTLLPIQALEIKLASHPFFEVFSKCFFDSVQPAGVSCVGILFWAFGSSTQEEWRGRWNPVYAENDRTNNHLGFFPVSLFA